MSMDLMQENLKNYDIETNLMIYFSRSECYGFIGF